MKKVLAILLATAMVLSLSVAAFATVPSTLSGAELDGDESGDVIVNVKDKNGNEITGTKVYKVTITWEDLVFTFKADQEADEILWDPDTHTYNITGKWYVGDTQTNEIENAVKLANHSNAEVTYGFKFENALEASPKLSQLTSGVTAELTGTTEGTLASAEGTAYADAPAAAVDVEVDEDAIPTKLQEFTVDTVIVTLTK